MLKKEPKLKYRRLQSTTDEDNPISSLHPPCPIRFNCLKPYLQDAFGWLRKTFKISGVESCNFETICPTLLNHLLRLLDNHLCTYLDQDIKVYNSERGVNPKTLSKEDALKQYPQYFINRHGDCSGANLISSLEAQFPFPGLSERIEKITNNFCDNITQFCQRLSHAWPILIEHFRRGSNQGNTLSSQPRNI